MMLAWTVKAPPTPFGVALAVVADKEKPGSAAGQP